MTEHIFGRDRELAAIRLALDETAAGAGGCHVLGGPAGIGKSRLLRVAGDMADVRNIAVAAREAFPHDLAAPLVTLAGALRNCSPPSEQFRWLSEPGRHEDAYLLLERLRASLENFAAERPLLIVIDDAHWMDELSALAVRELVPALASFPIRWIFASRPDRTEGPGRQTLDWLRRGGVKPMTLGVLDDAAVAGLCGTVLGVRADNTVLELAAGCGGNPLRIEQLLSALSRTGQLMISGGTATVVGADLPSSFVDTVRDILASLSDPVRRLLHAGSVLTRPFGIEAAARLMRRDPADLFVLLDEAMQAGLLVEDTEGLAFAHDLVRQAVYNALPRAVREQLHRDAAAVAREQKRPALEVAEHLLRGGRTGTAEAVELLRAAAADMAATAPATAADLILHAVNAGAADDPRRGELVADAVGLLASAGRLAEALSLGEEALHAGLDAETEAAILLGLAEAFKHAGNNRVAVEYTGRGLEQTGISDGLRARLHAVRAHALVYVDELDAADASGAEADRLGRESDCGASVFGLTARSLVAQAQGRMDDALRHAEVATAMADQAGGAALHRHPRIWLGSALTALDRFDEAEDQLGRGRRASERMGTGWAQPLWHYYQTAVLIARGRLDDAAAEADAGLATAEQIGVHQLAVPLLGQLIRLAVLRGDLGQAQVSLVRMRRITGTGVTAAPEDVIWPEALLLAAGGDPRGAFALVTGLCDAMPDRCALLGNDPPAAADLVRLALAAGDCARATAVAETARLLAGRDPRSRSAAAAAAHAEGLQRGDAGLLRAAVDMYRTVGRPLALAAALEDSGALEEALDIVTACGAHGAQRRLEARLGRRPGVRTPTPVRPTCLPQLTEAERNVALLVADGLTNLQVAERLYLSRHTVDSHLRKIFGKLDIRRRVELAAVVVRECGPSPPQAHVIT